MMIYFNDANKACFKARRGAGSFFPEEIEAIREKLKELPIDIKIVVEEDRLEVKFNSIADEAYFKILVNDGFEISRYWYIT